MIQEKQQVQDQQSYIPIYVAYSANSSNNYE